MQPIVSTAYFRHELLRKKKSFLEAEKVFLKSFSSFFFSSPSPACFEEWQNGTMGHKQGRGENTTEKWVDWKTALRHTPAAAASNSLGGIPEAEWERRGETGPASSTWYTVNQNNTSCVCFLFLIVSAITYLLMRKITEMSVMWWSRHKKTLLSFYT